MSKMNMKLKAAVILFLGLTLFSAASSQQDGRYLNRTIIYKLSTDGSWVKDYQHLMRYDTYYTTRRMGETFISYNPAYQKLEVLKSITTMKDGKKVSTPPNALNEVLPRNAAYQSAFSHLREMVVTHTGLERGAQVELHYQVTTQPTFMPYFSALEFLDDRLPVDHLKIEVSIPASLELRYHLFNGETRPETRQADGRKIYSFAFRDIQAHRGEPDARDCDRLRLLLTTAADWSEAFPAVDDRAELPPLLVEEIEKVKADKADPLDWYIKFQKMVAHDIDNSDLGADLTGIHYRSPQEVFSTNYGTRWEKAVLLKRILKHMGAAVEIIAVPCGEQLAKGAPSISQAEQFLVKIAGSSDQDIFLNPFESQDHLIPYPLAGRTVYNIDRRGFDVLTETDWQQHGLQINGSIAADIEKGNGEGELYISLKGNFFPYLSNMEDPQSLLQKTLADIIKVDKLEIKRMILLNPRECRAEVKVQGDFLKKLTENSFTLEKFKLSAVDMEMAFQGRRHDPLHLAVPFQITVNLQVKTGKGLVPDYLSPPVRVGNEIGYYQYSAKVNDSGHLEISQEIGIKNPLISPENYELFRSVLLPYFMRGPLAIFTRSK